MINFWAASNNIPKERLVEGGRQTLNRYGLFSSQGRNRVCTRQPRISRCSRNPEGHKWRRFGIDFERRASRLSKKRTFRGDFAVLSVMRFRYILRRLAWSPLFAATAILTVALGIGANTAIFSVIEGVLLKPLPYPNPEELIEVNHAAPGVNIEDAGAAPFLYFTYRDESRAFQQIGMWNGDSVSVTGVAEPEEVDGVDVTADVLPILGVQPVLGRLFSRRDDSPGSPETVLLTFGYWRTKFGGSTSVIGRRILIDGRAREVIGVLPRGFRFLDEKPVLIMPMQLNRSQTFLGNFSYRAVGRLKPGATIDQATADIARMIPIALRKFPAFPGFNIKMFEEARLGPTCGR